MKKPKHFKPSSSAESQFSKALRKVGRASGHIVEAHVEEHTIRDEPEMQRALRDYSKLITPWAKRQSKKMLETVSKSNSRAYKRKSKLIGKAIKLSPAEQAIDDTAKALMNEQVELIKSIPLRAGLRAQELALSAAREGRRASEVAEELARSTKVSESSAKLIARTEVARANASFTQARAQAIGSTTYIWRTTMDGAERLSHKQMNGKYIQYAKEPTLSDGTRGHAGTFPNCRCYQDVQFDSE